jgi:hypothetical protein
MQRYLCPAGCPPWLEKQYPRRGNCETCREWSSKRPEAALTWPLAGAFRVNSDNSSDMAFGRRISNVATSGFLGFGTRLVAVPEGKFRMAGTVVRVTFTADEVSKLPHQGP